MYPWMRLFKVAGTVRNRPPITLFETTIIRLRAWPNDLDFNLHVNNGRYLTLADLGRMDWFMRTGLLALGRRKKTIPVVGDAIAKFRRELRAFQSFELHTRLVGWDHKWGYLEHRFIRGGRVLGVVAIRGVFTGPKGAVEPGELLGALGHAVQSPGLPDWAASFQASSEQISSSLRRDERPAAPWSDPSRPLRRI